MAKKIAALLLTLFWPLAAQAADIPWQMREVRRPQGSLDYCVADHALPDGRHINLARDPEGRMNLGLVLPRAGFTPQQKLPLQLAFDKAKPRPIAAQALNDSMLLIDLPDASWQKALAQSRALTIGGLGRGKLTYQLGKLQPVLDGLADCTKQQQQALPAAILDLLQRAGLADGLEVMPPPATLGFVDFAWRRGAINGGTQAFEPKPDFRAAVRGQLAILKNYCQGFWSSDMGLIMVRGSAMQQQGVLTCNAAGREEVMAVLFAAPGDGTARYFTHAGGDAERDAVVAATAALAQALKAPPTAPVLTPPAMPQP